ncbi:MAG: hypothetical protein OEM52_03905 [bacterium]|nr:hypothetical protein [bacterium]
MTHWKNTTESSLSEVLRALVLFELFALPYDSMSSPAYPPNRERIIVVSTPVTTFITPFDATLRIIVTMAFPFLTIGLFLPAKHQLQALIAIGISVAILALWMFARKPLAISEGIVSSYSKNHPFSSPVEWTASLLASLASAGLSILFLGYYVAHGLSYMKFTPELLQREPTYLAIALTGLLIVLFLRKRIVGREQDRARMRRLFTVILAMTLLLIFYLFSTNLPSWNPLLSERFRIVLPDIHDLPDLPYFVATTAFAASLALFAVANRDEIVTSMRDIAAPKRKNAIVAAAFAVGMLAVIGVVFSTVIHRSIYGLIVWNTGGLPSVAIFVFVMTAFCLFAYDAATRHLETLLLPALEAGYLPLILRFQHTRFGTYSRLLLVIGVVQFLCAIILLAMNNYAVAVTGWLVSISIMASSITAMDEMLKLRKAKNTPPEVTGSRLKLSRRVSEALLLMIALITMIAVTGLLGWKTSLGLTILVIFTTTYFVKRFGFAAWLTEPVNEPQRFELESFKTLDSVQSKFNAQNRPILIAARHPQGLSHLRKMLEMPQFADRDIVVMTVRIVRDELETDEITVFGRHEKMLFQEVMKVAESYGKVVLPLVVTAPSATEAIVAAAARLHAEEIVLGLSGKVSIDEQMKEFLRNWKTYPKTDSLSIRLRIITSRQEVIREIS